MSSLRRRNPSSEGTTAGTASSSSNPGSSSAGSGERRLSFLKPTPKEPIPITLLIEIVSAYDLITPFDNTDTADPFVIIRKGSNEIHRTKPIRKNIEHPIWTIGTNSLYLLKTTKQELDKDDGLNFEVYHRAVSLGMVTVSSRALFRGRGKRIEYPLKKRMGLKEDKKGKQVEQKGILALRFRHASEKDIAFMDPKNRRGVSRALGSDISEVAAGASDMNFKKTTGPSVFKSTSKTGRDKIERFRVQPYPDPEKVEETRWLSDNELDATCLLPSRKWVEAGSGIMGMIYVEILKCDKLPNMDTGVNDKTDAFVALSFEDALVRTDVIHDSLSPRWMPWCTRAFAFPIAHVSSILMMSVFDYDAGPLNYHDPIGRVVINTSHFRSRTSYVLHYALHEDPNQNAEPRGTLCIRFRVDWGDEKKTIQQAFTKPPRFHVNVENEKAFKVLRYMCEGEINMDKATMTTTKLYAYELGSYIIKYFYVIDVLVGVLLWRGRVDFTMKRPDWITTTTTATTTPEEKKSDATNGETKTDETNNNQENPNSSTSSSSSSSSDDEIKFNVWFPIHSIALFQAGIIVIEKPWLLPAFFFLSIAWVMHTINYRTSRHPSPWRRCKSMHESNMVLMGRPPYPPVTVKANEGIDESTKLLLVDEVKRDRILNFFISVLYAGLKYRRLNKSADMESYAIATEDKQWTFLGDKLYYLHLLFSMLCVYLRMGRNVINWDSHYSRWLTVTCAAAGVILLILPMRHVMLWTARILVWSLLGPWMKFVDMRYFRPHYKTFEELMAMDEPKAPEYDIDALLEGVNMEALKRQARIATEDSIKLKEMRDLRFGKFSELVPSFDISRFPSVPLPESTAEPYLGDDDDEKDDEAKEEPPPSSLSEDNPQQQQKEGFRDLPREDVHWSVVPGQKLKGTMIQSIQTSENFGCDQSLVTKSIDEYDEISSVDNSAHGNS